MRIAIVCLLACAAAASVASAAEILVSQRNRAFSVREITLQRGDELWFVNDDYYGHNVYSEGAGFDIGLQEPGERRFVAFDEAGRFLVRCHIHPKMRLTVVVEE